MKKKKNRRRPNLALHPPAAILLLLWPYRRLAIAGVQRPFQEAWVALRGLSLDAVIFGGQQVPTRSRLVTNEYSVKSGCRFQNAVSRVDLVKSSTERITNQSPLLIQEYD